MGRLWQDYGSSTVSQALFCTACGIALQYMPIKGSSYTTSVVLDLVEQKRLLWNTMLEYVPLRYHCA